MYIRGNKGDYDEWADLGNVGWDYESILQLYLENEHVISQPNNSNAEYGKDGFQIISWYDNNNLVSRAITDGASELGYPTLLTENPLSPLGYFQALVTINNGVRANAARGFLGQVKNRTNLFVATNVTVTKVLIDQDLKATGVQIKVGDDLLEINASKEVIVSAGSINTPQILMLSGVGPLSHLNDLGIKVLQDLPVGQNLQDHLYIPVPVQMNGSAVTNQPRSAAIDNLYQYFSYRTGPVGTLGMSNLQGFINTKNNSIYPNMQVVESFNPPGDQNGLPAFLRVTGYSPEIAQQYVEINRLNASASFYSILLKPESRGSILLNSTNPLDKPLIYSGYLTDENDYDLETLLEGVRYTQRLLQTNPLRKLNATTVPLILPNCPELEFDTDDYWKCFIRTLGSTLYHPVGTSKMGPDSDPTSVVDPRLRVRGISNLRVADASIMPRIISGNTNAISLAIGLNAGKLINEDWS
ncbi:glucose dehydrogenase [FAD, quinone]-like [Cylas formicarius]|nr:glucose dehydrogenase [FAD, quinone]-like [Cylas formicarius]